MKSKITVNERRRLNRAISKAGISMAEFDRVAAYLEGTRSNAAFNKLPAFLRGVLESAKLGPMPVYDIVMVNEIEEHPVGTMTLLAAADLAQKYDAAFERNEPIPVPWEGHDMVAHRKDANGEMETWVLEDLTWERY